MSLVIRTARRNETAAVTEGVASRPATVEFYSLANKAHQCLIMLNGSKLVAAERNE